MKRQTSYYFNKADLQCSTKSPDFIMLEKSTSSCVFFVGKIIIFVNNMESRSFPSSPDIAGRYAKHRVLDFCMLRGTGNAPHLALQMQ